MNVAKRERVVSPAFRRQKGKSVGKKRLAAGRKRECADEMHGASWEYRRMEGGGGTALKLLAVVSQSADLYRQGNAVLKVLHVASARREIYGRYRTENGKPA